MTKSRCGFRGAAAAKRLRKNKTERISLKSKNLRGGVLLLITAMIWGAAFVAQSAGMEYIGPFTFNGIRMLLGGVVLMPFIWRTARRRAPAEKAREDKRALWLGGVLCGVALFVGSTLQQIGIADTSAGKAGFITAMYVVLVPLCGLLLGKRETWLLWVSVALACVGLYLLCVRETAALTRGDLMVLLGALGFTAHILLIDHFSPKVDGVQLSCIQFLVSGALALCFMAVLETPTWAAVRAAWLPLAYTGVFSCGVAYTLQILGQKDTDPTVASLILCLESVFSVLFSWLLLHERLSAGELAGCALMFAAILLAQFSGKKAQKSL